MKLYSCIIFLLLACASIFGQSENESYSLKINESDSTIKIDGLLNESTWKNADTASGFYQNSPFDTGYAVSPTKVMMTYDNNNLYIAAICYNTTGKKNIVRTLKRDYSFSNGDAFQVIFDPFDDRTNGFVFGTNPYGVQQEGLITGGGNWGASFTWDNKWFTKVKRYKDKWIVEMAIPFKSIRFKGGVERWRINFARNDVKRNEVSTWSPVPRNFSVTTLTFCGNLNWDKPVSKTGTNISVIPYTIGNANRNFLENDEQYNYDFNAGGDAKVAVTSSLNLDLTVNPDFSQVEADQQVTNLSRFSIFYPEKRQFFLENSDLFGSRGFSKIRPFFSRKIGLTFNEQTGIYEQTPILAGARLSGKVNKDWRVGLLNMTTPQQKELNSPIQNYTVAVAQRQIQSNSNLTGFVVSKQAMGNDSTSEVYINNNDYNRIVGLDYNFATEDNKWKGIFFYHQSITPEIQQDQAAHASFLAYNTQNLFMMWNHEYIGKNYIAEAGFVPRRGIWRLEPSIAYTFYPESETIAFHRPELYSNLYFDHDFKTLDREVKFTYEMNFLNTSRIKTWLRNSYTRLRFGFDPSGSGGKQLPAGSDYDYNVAGLIYSSDARRLFNFSTVTEYGTYYNGTRFDGSISFGYRAQPWGNFSLSLNQYIIELPEPYSDANWTLIGPKIDLSLTKEFFWTTYVQYNAQQSNLNINSRFQWRFRPLSDIYIVYTDNYFATSNFRELNDLRFNVMGKRNRALVVKLIYWINV